MKLFKEERKVRGCRQLERKTKWFLRLMNGPKEQTAAQGKVRLGSGCVVNSSLLLSPSSEKVPSRSSGGKEGQGTQVWLEEAWQRDPGNPLE